MRIIGNNPAADNAEITAVASGTLPNGKPVIVNADGTVSVVAGTSASQASYSQTTLPSSASSDVYSVVYSPDDDKIVVLYTGTSSYPYAVVGTISGTSISFGTPVVVVSTGVYYSDATYDTSANKVILCIGRDGFPSYGTAYAVTISGTNLSLGTGFNFKTSSTNAIEGVRAVFDSSTNRTIVTYISPQYSNNLRVTALTCTGSTISYAISPVSVNSTATGSNSLVFDSDQNVVMSIWFYGTVMRYRAYTTSGSSFSFGSEVTDNSSTSTYTGVAYDPNTQKHLVVLRGSSAPNYTLLLPVTLSGTTVTIGTPSSGPAVAAQNGTNAFVAYYDSKVQKVTVLQSNSSSTIVYPVDMSGSSPVAGTYLATGYASNGQCAAAFVSTQNRAVLSFNGKASLYENDYIDTNLTSENYIGFANGAAADTGTARVQIGSGINGAQSSLTAGQQYFVQTDGTLGLTAADPSVIAGTAISATEIIIKG